jgi:hypothetical protein
MVYGATISIRKANFEIRLSLYSLGSRVETRRFQGKGQADLTCTAPHHALLPLARVVDGEVVGQEVQALAHGEVHDGFVAFADARGARCLRVWV